MQGPLPEQAPDQPANLEPAAAAAFRVTVLPSANRAAQALPQLIPAGALDTEPEPLPVTATVSGEVSSRKESLRHLGSRS